MKKVLIIGATGTLGKAIVKALECDSQLIQVSHTAGEYSVDLSSTESIQALYRRCQDVDAVVCAAGPGVVFAPLEQMSKQDYLKSLQSKQLGQIDLVIQGLKQLGDEVSYTLTTGLLNYDPIASGSAAAMVNGAVEGFMRAAAIEMPARQRINVVSPPLLLESLDKYRDFFPGNEPVSAERVALAYRKSVLGRQSGKVMRVGWSC